MPDPLYIVAKYPDGRQVVLSGTPKPGEYPLDPSVTAALDVATEAPAGAIKVRQGDNASEALRSAKAGDVVLFRRGDQWPNQIPLSNSQITIGCFGDSSKPRPIIGGLRLTAPVSDVLVEDLDVQPICEKPEERILGIRLIQAKCVNLTFRRIRVAGFEDGVALHLPVNNAPLRNWHMNVLFDRVHLLDGLDVGKEEEYRGQGIFAINVEGLTFRDSLFDNNGRSKVDSVFRHGVYVGVHSSNVVARGCMATNNASIGIMTRAPGSVHDQNFYYGNGICALLNGASGTLAECVGVRGHFTTQPGPDGKTRPNGERGGRHGFDLHIGKGSVKNNLLLGPADPAVPKGHYQHAIGFSVSPRKTIQGWEHSGPCKPATDNNLDRMDRTIDATAEIQAARATAETDFDITPIREALFAKARAAARS